MDWKKFSIWGAQIISALVVLQTLQYKFTAHPESVMIFTLLGAEPWGRIILGIVELVVGISLLIPRTAVYGAIMTVLLMLGAIVSHVLVLGINTLFFMAVGVLLLSVYVVVMRRGEIKAF